MPELSRVLPENTHGGGLSITYIFNMFHKEKVQLHHNPILFHVTLRDTIEVSKW